MFKAVLHKTRNIKNLSSASDTACFQRCLLPLKFYAFIHSFILLSCGTHPIMEKIVFDSVYTTLRGIFSTRIYQDFNK